MSAPLRIPYGHDHDDDHDDVGGLHRDLRATGGVMHRREVVRLVTSLGAGRASPGRRGPRWACR